MSSGKSKISGFTIASLILGVLSFIPLVGVLPGVIAVVLGVIGLLVVKKSNLAGAGMAKWGIALGVLGILFTVTLYGSIYFGVEEEKGPFSGMKADGTRRFLPITAGALELYRREHGTYPSDLQQISGPDSAAPTDDFYGRPLHYRVSEDGQTYELRSLGKDGQHGTADDIIFGK